MLPPMEPIGPFFTSVFAGISQLVPITVLAAVLLFGAREILELRRRKAADKRKRQAFMKVLARECELNLWRIERLSEVLSAMQEAGVKDDASLVQTTKGGEDSFIVIVGPAGNSRGLALRPVTRSTVEKHLVEIAALDEQLYSLCDALLDGLADTQHVFRCLTEGPPIHFPSTPGNYYDGVATYGIKAIATAKTSMSKLYKECTGHELSRGRVR